MDVEVEREERKVGVRGRLQLPHLSEGTRVKPDGNHLQRAAQQTSSKLSLTVWWTQRPNISQCLCPGSALFCVCKWMSLCHQIAGACFPRFWVAPCQGCFDTK